MALPYPNPSLSEMAEEELRSGSVSDESQSLQTKERSILKTMALRRVLLTTMYESSSFILPHRHPCLTRSGPQHLHRPDVLLSRHLHRLDSAHIRVRRVPKLPRHAVDRPRLFINIHE
jgi:hypothetical protein